MEGHGGVFKVFAGHDEVYDNGLVCGRLPGDEEIVKLILGQRDGSVQAGQSSTEGPVADGEYCALPGANPRGPGHRAASS